VNTPGLKTGLVVAACVLFVVAAVLKATANGYGSVLDSVGLALLAASFLL
jgi:hypothetical protein